MKLGLTVVGAFIVMLLLSFAVCWFFGWLITLAIAAIFDYHVPVWAATVILFVLSSLFSQTRPS